MSSIVKSITNAFNSLVAITLTITLIGPVLSQFSDDFKDWYVEALEPVMAIFGIEDEDVIGAEVTDQRMMDDADVASLMTKIALEHQQTQKGIMELIADYSSRTRSSLGAYFNYGKDTFYNGLPTTNVQTSSIPDEVYNTISIEYGSIPVVSLQGNIKVPSKDEHLAYQLNKLYGYSTWSNELEYTDGNKYSVEYSEYNYITDAYDTSIVRKGIEKTETTISITPFDETTDTKTTTTEVTVVLLEETIVVSTDIVEEFVPIGTVVDSYEIVEIDTTYGQIILSILAPPLTLHYVIQWYSTDSSHIMYWTYEIGSGNELLDSSIRYITQLDMLPVIEIRNNKININTDKESIEYVQSKKILDFVGVDIDSITDSIVDNPSVDQITNAYVYFGVDLSDTDEIVAKVLYKTFEFLYDQNLLVTKDSALTDIDSLPTVSSFVGEVTSYNANVTEGNYNSTMIWKSQTRYVREGVIGTLGEYKSSTSGVTLTLQYQVLEDEYIEYVIADIASTTFVKEGGLVATVAKQLETGGVIMPLSNYIVSTLSPMEQYEVFGKSLRLAVYSAEVQHLEYYQTARFYSLIKIAVVIVGIIAFILSLPSGGQGAAVWFYIAAKFIVIYAVSYAFMKLLEHTNNPWLKALYIAIAAVALSYGANMDTRQLGFWTVDQVGNSITQYNTYKMEQLADAQDDFQTAADDRYDTFEDANNASNAGIGTEFVAELSSAEEIDAYIEGPALNIYRAVGIQSDSYELAIHTPYDSINSYYDDAYKLGIL